MTQNEKQPELLPCQLKKMFFYDPLTGVILWKKCPKVDCNGKQAGSKDSNGRLRIEYNGRTYAYSHVAWALWFGEWPKNQVDHINRNRTDNRICNLREATNAENTRNKKGFGRTGYKGVTLHKGKYIARIGKDYKIINLGSFDSAIEASKAYQKAAKQYHGEFACLK